MNNIFVYCEVENGVVADVSLELCTKGRKLADRLKCKLEAVVIGAGLASKNRSFLMGLIRFG
jgi:electron transfer flavoprotein alpha subunit